MSSTELQDQDINCIECARPFKWPVREQQFYTEKGFKPPRRCKSCREERKAQQEASKS